MNKGNITAADIARIAGVSRSTVAGVVNNYSYISTETKVKVRAVIDQYGYVPNSAARRLVGKKAMIIGHFIYGQQLHLTNSYINRLIIDVIEEAQKSGYSVVTCIIKPDYNDQVMTLLRNGTVQGAIVTGGGPDTMEIDDLLKSGFPAVFVNKLPETFSLDQYRHKHIVKSNNFQGGYRATKYLLDRGHRDIMHITGLLDRLSSKDRLLGYRKAMEDYGLTVREERVLKGDYTKSRTESLFAACLESGDLPTAIFAANDMTAIGVLNSCSRAGIRVPEDISLIGFDNMPITSELQPSLTTMSAGDDSLARYSVAMLLDSLTDDSAVPGVKVLNPELIERESVRKLKSPDSGDSK